MKSNELIMKIPCYRASYDVTVFQNNEPAAMLVYQDNPVGVKLFSNVNAFFYCNKFLLMLGR